VRTQHTATALQHTATATHCNSNTRCGLQKMPERSYVRKILSQHIPLRIFQKAALRQFFLCIQQRADFCETSSANVFLCEFLKSLRSCIFSTIFSSKLTFEKYLQPCASCSPTRSCAGDAHLGLLIMPHALICVAIMARPGAMVFVSPTVQCVAVATCRSVLLLQGVAVAVYCSVIDVAVCCCEPPWRGQGRWYSRL